MQQREHRACTGGGPPRTCGRAACLQHGGCSSCRGAGGWRRTCISREGHVSTSQVRHTEPTRVSSASHRPSLARMMRAPAAGTRTCSRVVQWRGRQRQRGREQGSARALPGCSLGRLRRTGARRPEVRRYETGGKAARRYEPGGKAARRPARGCGRRQRLLLAWTTCGREMTVEPTSKSPIARDRHRPPGQMRSGPSPASDAQAGPLPARQGAGRRDAQGCTGRARTAAARHQRRSSCPSRAPNH